MALGKKINRNQWISEEKLLAYKDLMTLSWEEIERNAPKYYKRLRFSLSNADGKVLELGCGIGTMSRWLSELAQVEHIWAVDAFKEAIETLKAYSIPKVTPLTLSVENLRLISGVRFDTVMICELLEHLYTDEERTMLESLNSLIDSMTKFIISVPIGPLQDPHHVRSFSKEQFRKHLVKYYGNPIEIDYSSGYSQVAWGYFNLDVF
jgi:2-polyprenyl-3-methyl-5-hydroxy-6-metoxy-1,4-benzoquinol methylase